MSSIIQVKDLEKYNYWMTNWVTQLYDSQKFKSDLTDLFQKINLCLSWYGLGVKYVLIGLIMEPVKEDSMG